MASGVSGMRLGAAAVAAASQGAESRDPPAGRLRKAWRILRMLYRNDVTRYIVCSLGARPSKNRKGGSSKRGGVEVYTAEC